MRTEKWNLYFSTVPPRSLKGTYYYLWQHLTTFVKKPLLKKNQTILFAHFLATKYLGDEARLFLQSLGFATYQSKGLRIYSVTPIIFEAIEYLSRQLDTVAPLEREEEVKQEYCTNQCGFYGAFQLDGLCSLCHKTRMKQKQKQRRSHWRVLFYAILASHRLKRNIQQHQENLSRCWQCHRRVGMGGIPCRCGYVFCGIHRYPYEHKCECDFKKSHKAKLRKENPVIKKRKYTEI